MATLFALVYPDQSTADQTLQTAKGLQDAGFMRILEQVVIVKDANGKIDLEEKSRPVRSGVIGGLVLGGLTGLIFTIPIIGLAAGAALGGIIGRGRKSGAADDFDTFKKSVSDDLQPNGSAVLLLASTDGPERVVHELSKHGGKLYSTDLSDDQIAAIQKEIDKAST
jgi:uncharacterized membrane protein